MLLKVVGLVGIGSVRYWFFLKSVTNYIYTSTCSIKRIYSLIYFVHKDYAVTLIVGTIL